MTSGYQSCKNSSRAQSQEGPDLYRYPHFLMLLVQISCNFAMEVQRVDHLVGVCSAVLGWDQSRSVLPICLSQAKPVEYPQR